MKQGIKMKIIREKTIMGHRCHVWQDENGLEVMTRDQHRYAVKPTEKKIEYQQLIEQDLRRNEEIDERDRKLA